MRIYIAEDDPSVIGVLEDILESSALGRVCGASEEGPRTRSGSWRWTRIWCWWIC